MKSLRIFSLTAGSVALALASFVAACSDSEVVATVDGGPPDSATPETSRPDANVEDSDVPDVVTDAPNPDAGLKLDTYANEVAGALCDALTRCCFGLTNVPEGGAVDGGTFDRPECIALYREAGFESSLYHSDALTKGNVTLDQAKGAECLQKIRAMSCNISGADFKAVRTSCFAAVTGKLAANQPCRSSIECAPGHFCSPDQPDAALNGVGTTVYGKCAPLKASGQNCSILEGGQGNNNDSLFAEEACSYRAGGDTGLHCDSWDDVNNDFAARNEWTCKAGVANGETCNSSVWCADGLCDTASGDFKCKSPQQFFSGTQCAEHVNQ